MRPTHPLMLAAAAALVLSGCAPGDLVLTEADRAARANGLTIAQTVQKKIGYHGSADFALSCASGMRITEGSARIANIAGSWNSPENYRQSTRLDEARGRVIATVTHIGTHAAPEHRADAPYVVVALTARCMPAASRG